MRKEQKVSYIDSIMEMMNSGKLSRHDIPFDDFSWDLYIDELGRSFDIEKIGEITLNFEPCCDII